MNSAQIIAEISSKLNIRSLLATFYEHEVQINWRQKYTTFQEKQANFAESLIHPPHLRCFQLELSVLSGESFNIYDYLKYPNTVVSISSLLNDGNNNICHLPLMNLHLDEYMKEDEIIECINLVTSGMPGYLMKTNRYFHFYGEKLLSESEWLQFNAQFLMPTIIASPRYIGHSLHQGFNTLRMTNTELIKTVEPFFIKTVKYKA